MEKKILFAVDDSIYAKQSIQYVARMLQDTEEVTYTLYHVQPIISQYLLDEARNVTKANTELKALINRNTETARGILERNKERMVRRGIAANCIDMVTEPRMLGLAKDIMEFARRGSFDAIVVGRRGLSRAQKVFVGSVSTKLLEHSGVIPVWVIDGDVTSSKVLVAVDGSECSIRAVDHLCFMFGENPEIQYTLFHVSPSVKDFYEVLSSDEVKDANEILKDGDRRCMDKFYSLADRKFRETGVRDSQIEIVRPGRNAKVGKMIIDEAHRGNYGTIVVGRRGVNRAFFFGSVSKYVTERITDRALWLVS
jgi:nucleotide-binding universal stress UspA family protein